MESPEQFDWDVLVPHFVHPLVVAVIEALLWVKEPLSAPDFAKLFNAQFNRPTISYHLDKLVEIDALVMTREQRTRGLPEKLYFFPPAK